MKYVAGVLFDGHGSYIITRVINLLEVVRTVVGTYICASYGDMIVTGIGHKVKWLHSVYTSFLENY